MAMGSTNIDTNKDTAASTKYPHPPKRSLCSKKKQRSYGQGSVRRATRHTRDLQQLIKQPAISLLVRVRGCRARLAGKSETSYLLYEDRRFS